MEPKNLDDLSLEILKIDDVESVAETIESVVDIVLDDGVVKEIPIVGWFISGKKAISTIRERMFLKKVAGFIKNLRGIPETEKREFISKLDDAKFRSKLSDAIICILDGLNDLHKPNYIGKIFRFYVLGRLNYGQFLALCDAVNYTYVGDLVEFEKYAKSGDPVYLDFEKYYRSGITVIQKDLEIYTQVESSEAQIKFQLSETGILFEKLLNDFETRETTIDISHFFEK